MLKRRVHIIANGVTGGPIMAVSSVRNRDIGGEPSPQRIIIALLGYGCSVDLVIQVARILFR